MADGMRVAAAAPHATPGPHSELAPGGRAALLAITAFIAASAVVSLRIALNLNVPGQAGLPRYGLQDFRDAFYWPGVALLDGRNPYDADMYLRTYPVVQRLQLYPPASLLLHLPFALLPPTPAGLLHHVLSLLLMPVLAAVGLALAEVRRTAARVFGVAALLVASHPGEAGLFVGQCHVYMVLAVYLTLRWARRRPIAAGVALAVALTKPTFGVPCALLMLVRREWRPVAVGVIVAGVTSLGVFLVMAHAAGGVAALLRSVLQTYAAFGRLPDQDAAASISRIDALALLGHVRGRLPGELGAIAVTALVLALAAWSLVRLERRGEGSGALSASICSLAILLCTYHQYYDAVIALVPAASLAAGRIPVSRKVRQALLVVLAVPAFNYVSTFMGIRTLEPPGPWLVMLSSLNGVACLLAFVACVVVCVRLESAERAPA